MDTHLKTQSTLNSTAPFAFASCATLFFIALNISWVLRYRLGQVVDIDEAGYFSIALRDYRAWAADGFSGWILEIERPTIQSPLTTATASAVYMIMGLHVSLGYAVPIMFGGGSILLTYLLGKKAGSKQFGALAAIFVALSPIMNNYSRTFNFAMAATFFTTASLVCLLYSERMSNKLWSMALGLSVGMMVLSRTVTISFFPAIGIAVLWVVFTRDSQILRAFFNAIIAGCVTVFTAALWLMFSWKQVFPYLFSFGYGANAASYGPSEFWESARLTIQIFAIYMQGVHTLWIAAGLCILSVFASIRFLAIGPTHSLKQMAESNITPICLFAFLSFAALMSTSNKGTGFSAPLFPAFAVISLYGFYRLNSGILWQRIFAIGIVSSSLVAIVPLISMNAPFFRVTEMTLPFIGTIPIASSRAPIHGYTLESSIGDQTLPAGMTEQKSKQWLELSKAVYNTLDRVSKADEVIKFGVRTYVMNGNSVMMFNDLASDRYLQIDQSPPFPGTAEDYLKWIQTGRSCTLLSSPGNGGDIKPSVDVEALERAAENAGFSVKETFEMPNGREIRFWLRPC